MPPYMIIILMISSTALLLVPLFIIRRKNRSQINDTNQQMASEPTEKKAQKNRQIPANPKQSSQSSTIHSSPHTPDHKVPNIPNVHNNPTEELMQLIKRFNFLSGENLVKFEEYLKTNQHDKIEQLISERFAAQGKKKPAEKAKEVTQKLLATLK